MLGYGAAAHSISMAHDVSHVYVGVRMDSLFRVVHRPMVVGVSSLEGRLLLYHGIIVFENQRSVRCVVIASLLLVLLLGSEEALLLDYVIAGMEIFVLVVVI